MGFNVYRFSISWSRIYPNGDDEVPNEKGLEFYHKVFAECKKHGIEPLVTINHHEFPLALAVKYDGLLDRRGIDAYVRYAKTLFTEYKDEVKYSWWSYRFNARKNNAGWRIDYFIISNRLVDKVTSTEIHNEIYGSDHCPVEIDIKL